MYGNVSYTRRREYNNVLIYQATSLSSWPHAVLTTQLQTLTSTAAAAVSSYHTTHLLISPTPTELNPSTIAATATSLPAPAAATSVIVYAAGVSGGVLVTILCCSMIIVILIVVRRSRRKTGGQATTAGQCITVCDHYSTVGSVLQAMITIQ